jgi:hypothetical protein
MSSYRYVTSKELHDKLRRLLELNVKFTRNIKSKYFCIYAKSRILAIKIGWDWMVNLDNWSINDPETLYRLGINAITPGSYAFNLLKEKIREQNYNYNTLWPTLSNHINKVIKSGYNSGLLYARPGFYPQKLWHYDINSAYGDAFKNVEVPIGIPKIFDKYIPPDNEHVNIYCMDLNVNYTNPKIFPYLVNSGDINKLPSEIISNTGYQTLYKVITQTEYLDIKKDYDVEAFCFYTLQFKKKKGLFDNFVDELFEKKNTSLNEERTVFKTILASLAGKLSQSIDTQSVPTGLNDFGVVEYETFNLETKDMEYINPAVSLFVVDYVRKKVRDIIKKFGYEHVILVDTDGFITTKPFDIKLSKELGGWKCSNYENVIINGKRSYFYTENGQFHSSISGLGDIYNDSLNDYSFDSIKQLYKLKQNIPVIKKVTFCGEEKYISLNISIGERT